MTEPTPLFDIDPSRIVPRPEPAPDPDAGLSPDQRRTLRQARDLAKGRHPITGYALHAEAAPADDRDAPGRRCGSCRFREQAGHHGKSYAKCFLPDRGGYAVFAAHSAASDCRAWWPGCIRHEPRTQEGA
jgi:hypothetical protein